jgi:hypothetical protein
MKFWQRKNKLVKIERVTEKKEKRKISLGKNMKYERKKEKERRKMQI